jgi:hypothetical protein
VPTFVDQASAIAHISDALGIETGGHTRADRALFYDCQSGRVRTQATTKGGQILAEPIQLSLEYWGGSYESRLELWIVGTGTSWGPEDPGELGGFEYCLDDLLALYPLSAPARTNRRRPKDTGYQKLDGPILEKMHQLMIAKEATSATDAANRFLSEARGASDEAKRRRLRDGYKARYGGG